MSQPPELYGGCPSRFRPKEAAWTSDRVASLSREDGLGRCGRRPAKPAS